MNSDSESENAFAAVLGALFSLRRYLILLTSASQLANAMAVGLALGLFSLVLEAFFFLPPSGRFATGFAVVAIPCCWLLVRLRQSLSDLVSLPRLGLYVESRCPQLQERVTTSLDLWHTRAAGLYSCELLARTVSQAAQMLAETDRKAVADFRSLKSNSTRLGVAALVAALSVGFAEELQAALVRCSQPLTHFARDPRTHIVVNPGDMELLKGDDALQSVVFEGEPPTSAIVMTRHFSQAPWRSDEIVVDGASTLAHVFRQVQQSFAFKLLANDAISPTYHVVVLEPPVVRRQRTEYHYPEYSKLPTRIEEDTADVTGLVGTKVHIHVTASKPLGSAALIIDDSLTVEANVEGNKARAQMTLNRSGEYYIHLQDKKGLPNRDPIRCAIQVDEDAAPQVIITDPGRDTDLPESLQLVLAIEGRDDFGITRGSLVYRLHEGIDRRRPLQFQPGTAIRHSHLWDLGTEDLLPEDRVTYFVEVYDNDAIAGPKVGRSKEYVLRFPSLHELYEEIAQEQDNQIDAMESLAEEGRKDRDYLEQVRRELLKSEKLSWEQKRELEATLARESERVEALEELAQELDETLRKMEEDDLASSELLDTMAEIRKLMAEVTSPELREALLAIQKATEELDPSELADALREFREDQEDFQTRLDQTLALLRQIRAEQRLEAVVRLAEDLEQRQRQIDAALESPSKGATQEKRLQAQETSLHRDTERLSEELRDLSGEMEAISPETAADLSAQADSMENQQIASRMEKMAERMEAGQSSKARKIGKSLEEDLGVLSASLSEISGTFSAREKEQISEALRQSMADLLYLSKRQENLRNRTQDNGPQQVAELAQDQFALLQSAGQISEAVGQISRQTMSLSHGLISTLGHALLRMQEAAHQLGQRNTATSVSSQGAAMGHLNEAALLLRESMDNVANAKMPSGFAEAMQQMMGMSDQQSDLNAATQQAMERQGRQQGRGGRQREDFAKQMARLAAQQRQIYQALQQLEKATRGRRGMQKRISEMKSEMESVLRDLQRRQPDAETLNSQNRILQRMLEASRSIRTRGFEEKRRSESGLDLGYSGPGEMDTNLGQSRDQLRDSMKQAMEGSYPDEYRSILRRYFESIYQDLAQRE